MFEDIWLLFGVMVLLILGFLLYFLSELRKKKKIPADYYSLFILGLIWLVIGVPIKNYLLSLVGLMISLIGFTNRDKWKKNKREWNDLDYSEKVILIIAAFILALFIFTAIMVQYLIKEGLLFR
jgi:hypothetical protein